MNYEALIIDGPYLAHRSLTAPYNLTTTTGLNATMLHSFLNTLLSLNNKYHPRTLVITWESHGTPSWRRQLYSDYKPSSNIQSSYTTLLPDLKMFLHTINLRQYYAASNEADDVIASLVTKSSKSALIFTTDKDIMQVVSNKEPHHILSNKHIFTEQDVIEKYMVRPYQIPDYLALVGDSCDNITGISGIGTKRASQLLTKYDTIEFIPHHKFKRGPKDFHKALSNKKLTLLNTEANIRTLYKPGSAISCKPKDILHKYELKQMLKRLPELRSLA